ncbi:hypothetical protein [Lacticaseibacillus paracasei]|uniref:hypothetical protein n=1 Tax=Lacticaseibacillus paracasei TaxID=1597 RepID=UPI000297EA45|nr:hypothetical protein LCA32G_1414 [Lacticaseibacillus paracasei]
MKKPMANAYVFNLIATVTSAVFSIFLITQNFPNVFQFGVSYKIDASNTALVKQLQMMYTPAIVVALIAAVLVFTLVITMLVLVKKRKVSALGSIIALGITLIQIGYLSGLFWLVQSVQSAFSPAGDILQNPYIGPLLQLINLLLLGGSWIANLVVAIDYRRNGIKESRH